MGGHVPDQRGDGDLSNRREDSLSIPLVGPQRAKQLWMAVSKLVEPRPGPQRRQLGVVGSGIMRICGLTSLRIRRTRP